MVEPLERGFGMTLGNSMRRVLLSSLPGVAATSIRIDGVLHEFSTIEGVKEDVTEIVLNLKGLICKLHSQGPKKVVIDAAGECEVTAGDILPDSDVEIINPELHLATLDENGKLHMEIMLDHGRGYVVADRNKRPDMPIGEIAVDSIYTPITKVNFTVDNTRVGQITDYDKLTLEIWTNGSIKPDEAASYAAKILTEHLMLFINLTDRIQGVEIMVEKEESKKEKICWARRARAKAPRPRGSPHGTASRISPPETCCGPRSAKALPWAARPRPTWTTESWSPMRSSSAW